MSFKDERKTKEAGQKIIELSCIPLEPCLARDRMVIAQCGDHYDVERDSYPVRVRLLGQPGETQNETETQFPESTSLTFEVTQPAGSPTFFENIKYIWGNADCPISINLKIGSNFVKPESPLYYALQRAQGNHEKMPDQIKDEIIALLRDKPNDISVVHDDGDAVTVAASRLVLPDERTPLIVWNVSNIATLTDRLQAQDLKPGEAYVSCKFHILTKYHGGDIEYTLMPSAPEPGTIGPECKEVFYVTKSSPVQTTEPQDPQAPHNIIEARGVKWLTLPETTTALHTICQALENSQYARVAFELQSHKDELAKYLRKQKARQEQILQELDAIESD